MGATDAAQQGCCKFMQAVGVRQPSCSAAPSQQAGLPALRCACLDSPAHASHRCHPAQTARLISDRDLQLLRRFDKKDPAYQAKLLEEVRMCPGCPGSSRICLSACIVAPPPPPTSLLGGALSDNEQHETVLPRHETCQCALLLPPLQSGSSYIEAFLTVLKNVTKDETVQYVLALVEQMLAGALAGPRTLGCWPA